LALTEKDISYRCIFHCIVVSEIILDRSLSSCCCAFHQLVNVSAAHSDRKQSYCCQYGETSSYIVRYYERLITFFCSEILESSLSPVCGRIDSLCSFLFSIFLLQDFLEHTERDRRFCCGS